ncbi:hypothetical protein G6F56_005206 [Rhizopus delemar]|nr:hypothetical protein G6F56_005206 [Rhizopus delemar]
MTTGAALKFLLYLSITADYDYNLRSASASKNVDTLGILSTQNNMELIVVESSSGRLKEHTSNTIDDSLDAAAQGASERFQRAKVEAEDNHL